MDPHSYQRSGGSGHPGVHGGSHGGTGGGGGDYYAPRGGHDGYQRQDGSGQHMKYAYPPSDYDGVQQRSGTYDNTYAQPSHGSRSDLARSHGYSDAVFGGGASELYVTPSERNASSGGGQEFAYLNYTQLPQQQQQQQQQQPSKKVGASELQPVIPGQQQNINIVQHPNWQPTRDPRAAPPSHVQLQQEQLQEMYRRQQQQQAPPPPPPQQRQPVQAIQPTATPQDPPRAERYQAYPGQQGSSSASSVPVTPTVANTTEPVTGNATHILQQLDHELKESQQREKKLKAKMQQAAEVEQVNKQLQQQQAQLLREAHVSKQQQQQGNTVLKALEEKVRSLSGERDSLNSQLDELMNRHNILQRSVQDLDQRKNQDTDNNKLLATQNVALTEEVHNLRAAREMSDKAAQKSLKELQLEFLTMKKQYVQLQADHEDETSTIASRLTVERDDAIKRLYDAEQKHVILSSQFNETEDKCRWLSEQVRNLEVGQKAQNDQHGRDLAHHISAAAKAEEEIRSQAERAGASSIARQEDLRLQHLYGLLKTLDMRWNKRFFKNHFLGWKFVWASRQKNAAEFAEADRAEGLKNILASWLSVSRSAKAATQMSSAIASAEVAHDKRRKDDIERLMGVHGENMAEASKRHETELENLRDRLSADLKKTRETLLDELQSGRQIHRSELERLAERGANEMRDLRKAHSEELASCQAQADDMTAKLEGEKAEAITRLETDKAQITAQLTGERDALSTSLRAEIANITTTLTNEKDKIKSELTAAHEATRARLEAEVEGQKTRFETDISQQRSTLEGEIARQKSELEGEIASQKDELEGKIASQKSQLEGEIACQKAELEGKNASLKKKLEGQLESLRIESQEAAQAATSKLSAEVQRAAMEMEAARKAHNDALAATNAAHAAQVKSLEEAHAAKVRLMEETSAASARKMEEAHQEAARVSADEMSKLVQSHSATVTALQTDAQNAQVAAKQLLDETKSALQAQLTALEKETSQQIAAKESSCASRVAAAEGERDSRVRELTEQHEATVAAIRGEAAAREEGLRHEIAGEREEWGKERESMQWSHSEALCKVQQEGEEEVSSLKTKWTEEVASLKAQWEEEVSDIKAKWGEETQRLKDDAAEMEANLRAQMVAEKARSDQEGEETRATWAKREEELRKRVLEKEKDIARNMQEAEEERQRGVDQAEEELKEVQKECDRKLDQMRSDNAKACEDLRAKMHSKEKDLMGKIESLRADNIRAQEQFQTDLQDKETSFQRRLDQEKSLQAQVDNLMSSTSVKELQLKITSLTDQLRGKQHDCEAFAEREHEVRKELESQVSGANRLAEQLSEAQNLSSQLEKKMGSKTKELQTLSDKNQDLAGRLEETVGLLRQSKELQASLVNQFEGSSGELEKVRTVQKEQHDIAVAAQREATKYQNECRRLDKELQEASQALLKRGDEFSETMSLLQGRFDAETREIQEKLRVSNATNVRLAAELEESSTLLLRVKDQTSGTQQAVEDLYKKKLAAAEQELKQANDTYQERLAKASSQAQAELQRKLGDASSRVQQAEERAVWVEQEMENIQFQMQQQQQHTPTASENSEAMAELQKRIERVERENDTLTQELDNCLGENAQLRSEIDSRAAGSPGGTSQDDDLSSAASSYGQRRINNLRGSVSSSIGARPPGISCGVHTVRLLRAAYYAWLDVTVEHRMLGKSPMFSGLDYFQSSEGSLSEWFPVGRIRRSELEIKNEKLGSGSFAEVYRGEFKLPCAVKKIRGSVQQRELLEFVREGEMLRSVSHPCIVKLLGVFQEGGTYSLVQECVSGVNIFDYLHKYHKTVPIGKQIGVALQVCDAMAYLHAMRIVHRDVKPQNVIYLEKTGTAKICDFGLARLIPVGVEMVDPVTLGTGGTPAYQAPEVLARMQAGRKLDLYGFAVTLWEMYTTKLPWSDCNLDQMTHRVIAKNERPPMPQDMPRGYAEVIARSWDKDPAKRPEFGDILPTLREMHDALNPAQSLRVHSSTSSLGAVSSASLGAASNASTSSQRSGAHPQQGGGGGTAPPRRPSSILPTSRDSRSMGGSSTRASSGLTRRGGLPTACRRMRAAPTAREVAAAIAWRRLGPFE